MNPHSPNKLIATEYCFLILRGDYQLFFLYFFIFRFFFVILRYFVIINFYKNYFIIIFLWELFLFHHVPGCSGIFRNVPFSGVYRRPLQNRKWKSARLPRASVCKTNAPFKIADRSMAGHFEFSKKPNLLQFVISRGKVENYVFIKNKWGTIK